MDGAILTTQDQGGHDRTPPLALDGSTRFRTTRWSVVLAVGSGGSAAKSALDRLYRTYWRPLFSVIARERGAERAAELTQAFFVSRLVERNDLGRFERRPGKRFRGWLCRSVYRFLANQRRFDQQQQRDEKKTFPLAAETDHLPCPPACVVSSNPEQQWRRKEVLSLLTQVLQHLREEYCANADAAGVDGARRFEAVKRFLPGPETEEADYGPCAHELGVGRDDIKQTVCGLRRRFGALLEARIRRSTDSEAEAKLARRQLCEALELPER